MAIDRISSGNPVPLITQRFDVSPATPMVPGVVQPLVPVGPYMAPAPDAGTLPAQLQQKAQDSLASLIKPNADGAGATPRDSSAMQVNQLFFTRQLVWQPPDAAQLAASWRVMVKTYGEQYAALQEQARGQHVPGNLFMAEQQPALLREGPRPPLSIDSEAWRFAVYGWGGQRLLLRVLASDDDEDAAPPRRGGKVALRVELIILGIGRVVIQMEPAGDGVLLELAADEEAALRHLRLALPDIADAVRRAGLRVLRCRLNRQLHAQRVHGNYPMQAAAASLSLPLFRAMAEVALLLTRPETEAAAEPDAAAPAAHAEAEEEVFVSKEVAAPLDYDYGDEEEDAAPGGTVLLLADGQEHELLPPIDEQD
ncbi:hypothetical protein [Janthinobacterium sp. 1_2014MBL_MicDiv]|uniref:hypothetical protein n=1 Tax=Janthinobacterium sp. 1_2014MBL_MicDiv TaxID=1644131 RepID=UPI000A722551|nr:hypothetical protein [Janthinobacterium sp. 1_2014MBL_MicDiv]